MVFSDWIIASTYGNPRQHYRSVCILCHLVHALLCFSVWLFTALRRLISVKSVVSCPSHLYWVNRICSRFLMAACHICHQPVLYRRNWPDLTTTTICWRKALLMMMMMMMIRVQRILPAKMSFFFRQQTQISSKFPSKMLDFAIFGNQI